MKPKDIFGLAVRILGLVILYHLLLDVPAIIPFFAGGNLVQIGLGLVGIAAALSVIWWLIGGAPVLMCRAYPEVTVKSPVESKAFEEVAGGTPCVSCGKHIPIDSRLCPACGWTQPR